MEFFAEDLKEGIAFNKSMTYKFPVFRTLAGDYFPSFFPTSSSRCNWEFPFRAVECFCIRDFFPPANNSKRSAKYNAGHAKTRVVASILEKRSKLSIPWVSGCIMGDFSKSFQQTSRLLEIFFPVGFTFILKTWDFLLQAIAPEYKDGWKGKSNPEAN